MKGTASPDPPKINPNDIVGGIGFFISIGDEWRDIISVLQAGARKGKKKYRQAIELLDKAGDMMRGEIVSYLDNCYREMWNVSSFLTGNLRASLGIIGNVYDDPYNAEIGIVEDKLLEPKTLPILREYTTTKYYNGTKKGKPNGKVSMYKHTYQPGEKMIARPSQVKYGTYADAQETTNLTSREEYDGPRIGGPFIYTVWQEIRDKYEEEYK